MLEASVGRAVIIIAGIYVVCRWVVAEQFGILAGILSVLGLGVVGALVTGPSVSEAGDAACGLGRQHDGPIIQDVSDQEDMLGDASRPGIPCRRGALSVMRRRVPQAACRRRSA